MKKDKNLARKEWLEMIEQSWTWAKLTKEEQGRFMELVMDIESLAENPIKGDYHQRWAVLHAIYRSFLCGLGYSNFKWREQ